ncbi:MAG: HD domain-containing protein [Candidatus Nanoarchaeia archaeon]
MVPLQIPSKEDYLQDTKEFAYSYYKEISQQPNTDLNTLLRYIARVQKYAKQLAKTQHASEYLVELASILHDIGRSKGEENHAISSFELSQKHIQKSPLGAVEQRIVLSSIIRHHATSDNARESTEEKIVRCAAALAELFDPRWDQIKFSKIPKELLKKNLEKYKQRLCLQSAQELARDKLDQIRKHTL